MLVSTPWPSTLAAVTVVAWPLACPPPLTRPSTTALWELPTAPPPGLPQPAASIESTVPTRPQLRTDLLRIRRMTFLLSSMARGVRNLNRPARRDGDCSRLASGRPTEDRGIAAPAPR